MGTTNRLAAPEPREAVVKENTTVEARPMALQKLVPEMEIKTRLEGLKTSIPVPSVMSMVEATRAAQVITARAHHLRAVARAASVIAAA